MSRDECKWGALGTIVAYHDSHGLCYEVLLDDGSDEGSYDPTELLVLTGKRLKVVQLGNPILFERAAVVGDIQAPEIQTLIDDMIRTCVESGGVGIAAPQVGTSLRIFIMASQPLPNYPDAPEMEPEAMINPVITERSEEEEIDWEGCLSVPGIRGRVSRSKRITVIYDDRDGKQQKKRLEGFLARIYQHEEDHLNGNLFLDHVDVHDLATTEELNRILKEKA